MFASFFFHEPAVLKNIRTSEVGNNYNKHKNEYVISLGVVHFNNMGDFGIRSKPGTENKELTIKEDAATVCFGFEMNVPKLNSKLAQNPYGLPEQTIYTQEAVNGLTDSLNQIIEMTQKQYNDIADSIKFLTFSEPNGFLAGE